MAESGFCGPLQDFTCCTVNTSTEITAQEYNELLNNAYWCVEATGVGSAGKSQAIFNHDDDPCISPPVPTCGDAIAQIVNNSGPNDETKYYSSGNPGTRTITVISGAGHACGDQISCTGAVTCGEISSGDMTLNTNYCTWYMDVHYMKSTIKMHEILESFECPPNMHYEDGTCVANDGYERNPECPDCTENCDCVVSDSICYECWYLIPGDIDCNGGLLELSIGYYNNGASVCGNFIVSGRPLQISYAGSTVPLTGPTEIMGSTFNQTKFYVSVPSTICSTDEIHVELINPGGVNLGIMPGCQSDTNVTNECPCSDGDSGGDDPGGGGEAPGEGGGGDPGGGGNPGINPPEPGIPEDTDCCTFFNDNYTEWEYTDCIDFFSDYPAKY